MEERTVQIKPSEGNAEKVNKIKLRRKKFKETVSIKFSHIYKITKALVFRKNVRMQVLASLNATKPVYEMYIPFQWCPL